MSHPRAENQIDYIEIPVTQMAGTKKFYAAVFGWTFEDYGPDYASFFDGRLGGGFTMERPAPVLSQARPARRPRRHCGPPRRRDVFPVRKRRCRGQWAGRGAVGRLLRSRYSGDVRPPAAAAYWGNRNAPAAPQPHSLRRR